MKQTIANKKKALPKEQGEKIKYQSAVKNEARCGFWFGTVLLSFAKTEKRLKEKPNWSGLCLI